MKNNNRERIIEMFVENDLIITITKFWLETSLQVYKRYEYHK